MNPLTRLLQAIAGLTIAVSLFSAAITYLGPSHWSLELFTHFRVQYLAASMLLLLLYAAMRSQTWMLMLGVVSVINAMLVLPLYWGTGGAEVGGSSSLKVVQANVHSSNDAFADFIAFVESEDPDVVFVQEVTEDWSRALAPLLLRLPYSYSQPRAGNFGIAVYSKLPFTDIHHVESPPFGYPTLFVELGNRGTSVNLVSTHPTIPLGESLFKARNRHLLSVAREISQLRRPVVLLGDLNASPWDPRFRRFSAIAGLQNGRKGFGPVPTWPTFFPPAMIPIDHVLVSRDVHIVDLRSGPASGSDHRPLIATLSY